jgi:protein phosphatase 2C family protein 2/3
MSIDHKPSDAKETKRIIKNGGSVYQTQSNCKGLVKDFNIAASHKYGPHRILPGRLSVSRAFGDIEAKLSVLGGNHNVLIATPDVRSFEINPDIDFLLLGSDGIYDHLSNDQIATAVWSTAINESNKGTSNFNEIMGD